MQTFDTKYQGWLINPALFLSDFVTLASIFSCL